MMPDTEPVVRVTLSAIYERVVSVEGRVAEIASSMPSTKEKQAEYEKRLNAHADRIDQNETRLTRLEAMQRPHAPWYAVVGAVVAILTGVGTIVTLLAILSRIPA